MPVGFVSTSAPITTNSVTEAVTLTTSSHGSIFIN